MKYFNIYVSVLKEFGDFKTRTAKKEFWVFVIVNIIISILLGIISQKLSSLYSLIVFVPSLAVGIRRLHDIGKNGWNILWGLLPVIGWIYLIILYLRDSEPQANEWGEVPEDVVV